MIVATEKTGPALMLDLMLEALRVDDPRLNAIATALIRTFGEQPLRQLVHAALDFNNAPRHRVRLLHVIQQFGLGSDPRNYTDLSLLVRDRSPAVRAAAKKLVGFDVLIPESTTVGSFKPLNKPATKIVGRSRRTRNVAARHNSGREMAKGLVRDGLGEPSLPVPAPPLE